MVKSKLKQVVTLPASHANAHPRKDHYTKERAKEDIKQFCFSRNTRRFSWAKSEHVKVQSSHARDFPVQRTAEVSLMVYNDAQESVPW